MEDVLRPVLDVAGLVEVRVDEVEEELCGAGRRGDGVPDPAKVARCVVDGAKVAGLSLRDEGELVEEVVCLERRLVDGGDDDEL